MTHETREMIVRNTAIRTDEHSRICLDDLWQAAQASSGKKPKFWRLTAGFKDLRKALEFKVGIPNLKCEVIEAARGQGMKGTYAHPILAAAYAGYLDSGLEVEMRDVWLRYRAGDPTLADEVLQRASAEANHRVGVRALSRSQRNSYTDILKEHGVEGRGYMECTEALYVQLLGGRSYELRDRMSLKPNTNIRDNLDTKKLAFVMAAEALAAERIEEEGRKGNKDCAEATAVSANAIKKALNDDRKNRQQRFVA